MDFVQEHRSTGVEADPPRRSEVLGISRRGFHRIAYTDWGDEGSARVAVCVHGLTRQGRDFDPLARALARHGYRVVCPDLVGRGRSGWLRDPDEYALPQYAMDLTVLLARLDAQEVDWVGTSLGGLVGIVLAGQEGGAAPIRRLMVSDIGPALPWAALHRIGTYLRRGPWDFPSLEAAEAHFREVLAQFGDLGDGGWRHLTEHSVERRPEDGRYRVLCDPGIARAFRPTLAYNLTLWRYWDAIRCPTLVLRGAASDLLPRETAAEMARRGPRAGCGDPRLRSCACPARPGADRPSGRMVGG